MKLKLSYNMPVIATANGAWLNVPIKSLGQAPNVSGACIVTAAVTEEWPQNLVSMAALFPLLHVLNLLT